MTDKNCMCNGSKRSLITSGLAIVVAVTLGLTIETSAQIPADCNTNAVALSITRPNPTVCQGSIIDYTVTVTNNSPAGLSTCQATNITVRFWAPNNAPNNASTCLATNPTCVLEAGFTLNPGQSREYNFNLSSTCADLDFVANSLGNLTAFACVDGTSQTIPGGEPFTAANQITTAVLAPPDANAGPDQDLCTAASGETCFTLAGSVTPPAAGHTWSVFQQPAGCTVTISDTGSLTPQVCFPAGCTGTAILRLTATNRPCAQDTEDVELSVTQGPSSNAGPDQTECLAASGQTCFNLTGSGSGLTHTWSVVTQPGGAGCDVIIGDASLLSTTACFPAGCTGTATLRLTFTGTEPCPNATNDIDLTVETCGGRACSPGYWGQPQHFKAWCDAGLNPGACTDPAKCGNCGCCSGSGVLFKDAFEITDFSGAPSGYNWNTFKLIDAFKPPHGGCFKQLLFQGAAGLLNSKAIPDYGIDEATAKQLMQDAFADSSLICSTAHQFSQATSDGEAEGGCPCNNDGCHITQGLLDGSTIPLKRGGTNLTPTPTSGSLSATPR